MLKVKFKTGNLEVLAVWVEGTQPMGRWRWDGQVKEGVIPPKAFSLFMECERQNKSLSMDVRDA